MYHIFGDVDLSVIFVELGLAHSVFTLVFLGGLDDWLHDFDPSAHVDDDLDLGLYVYDYIK